MELTLVWIVAGLQLKHFVADYVLQWPSMIHDKIRLDRPGGYMHAGIHVAGTLLVLLIAGISFSIIWKILIAEFVIHLLIDYAKARYSASSAHSVHTGAYWIAHGFDQLAHHMTYVGILTVIAFKMI